METELLPSVQGNVQLLRKIWNSRVGQEDQPDSSRFIPSPKKILDYKQFLIPPDPTIITFDSKDADTDCHEVISPIASSTAQTDSSKESIPMINEPINAKPAIHHWHVTRHVVRSGLIIHRARRASDSIVPLLKKTHDRQSPTHSIDSTFIVTPFESLVDYLIFNESNNETKNNQSLLIPTRLKRISSDRTDCIRRNKLEDSIVQYERILRHLKNYEQFMVDYSVSSTSPLSLQRRRKSFDDELILPIHEKNERSCSKTSRKSSQTQSLSFHIGRTFSEFIIQDLFSTSSLQSSPIEDESSPTDDALGMALHELDTVLEQVLPLTANSPVNVIVLNSPELSNVEPVLKKFEKPLIERLFDGKKTAFESNQCDIKAMRLPKKMLKEYEIIKRKCLDPSEEPMYATKMTKISRHHYKQDIRLFCITNKHIYNITSKKSVVKESLLLQNIIGVSCTPYKDGFICIHTKPSDNDRGDWLFVVEHPCELITYLFAAMYREDNHDNFLKFQSKISPRRQGVGEFDIHDDSIDVQLSSTFYLKANGKNNLTIFTP